MKIISLLFTLTLLNVSYSQKIFIVDSINNNLVPNTTIKYSENKGFYADETGFLVIDNLEFDTLEIHHINYKTKKIPYSKLTDTIKLTSVIQNLNEIFITNDNNLKKLKSLGLKKTRFCGSFPLFNKHKIITKFKTKKQFEILTINNFSAQFEKSINFANVKLQFFIGKITEKESDLDLIFLSETLSEGHFTKSNILNYKFKEKLNLPSEGFIIGLTFFTLDNQKTELRPLLSTTKNKYFQTETYIQYSIDNNFGFYSMNKCHKGELDYSLLVDFELHYK